MGPVIAEPRLETRFVVASDGAKLPLRHWQARGERRAVILALHGFNDYSRAFDAAGVLWSTRGLEVYAYDQRGFGAAPNRGVWAGIDTMISDLAAAAHLVRDKHKDLPFYLLGESMGGAVVMTAIDRAAKGAADQAVLDADGYILVAPAVWGLQTLSPGQGRALEIAAHAVPWLKLSGRGLRIKASDNIDMLRALGRDPNIIKKTRVDTIYGLAELMTAAFDAAPRLAGNALMLYGARDEIIRRRPFAMMLDQLPPAPAPRPRIAVYPGGYHMLTRDLNAAVVLADIAAWVIDPAAALPSGADAGGDATLAGGEEPE